MSQQISKPTILPVELDSFPKTTAFFDWLDYVVQRGKRVAWDAKELIVALLVLLLLIQHSFHVLLSG